MSSGSLTGKLFFGKIALNIRQRESNIEGSEVLLIMVVIAGTVILYERSPRFEERKKKIRGEDGGGGRGGSRSKCEDGNERCVEKLDDSEISNEKQWKK